jgi:hypothetical protein
MIKSFFVVAILCVNSAFAFEDDMGLHQYKPVNHNLPVVPVNYQEQKPVKKMPSLKDDDDNLNDRNYEIDEETLVPGDIQSYFRL